MSWTHARWEQWFQDPQFRRFGRVQAWGRQFASLNSIGEGAGWPLKPGETCILRGVAC